ncbi:MAG: AI-2E family transporter [Bacteroidetes bacterium]|nr:AI-2E family transporter [Bacteroidota bacterium]
MNNKQKKEEHQIVKKFTMVLLLLVGFAVLYSLRQFIDAFLGAVMIYILFRPLMRHLVHKRKWNISLSAVLVILITILSVSIPSLLVIKVVRPRVVDFFNHPDLLTNAFQYIDNKIFDLTGTKLINEDNLRNVQSSVAGYATTFLNETFSMIADLGIMFFILYFMLKSMGTMEQFFEDNLPLPSENIATFGEELRSMTMSNALGAPIMALIQGLIAVLGYWICGLPDPFLWGIVTGVFSFVPIIGSALIWIPAALYILSLGATWQPVGIVIVGIIISVSDNILRFALQEKFADVHPIITVLGVITGFYYFGLPGLIFGPLLISWFIILFKIFRKEYSFPQE